LKLSKLIHEVWKDKRIREIRLRKDEVKLVVEVLIDHIVKGLLKHGEVKMKNLFTLDIRKAKGRKIRNPQTGESMYSQDYYKVGLEPSKKLREGLKNLREEE
jgi:nucleoid DNA-binding protein